MSSFLGVMQRVIGQIGPYFLHNRHIGTFLEAAGRTLDGSLQSLEQGLELSNPLVCDPSAFPYLSRDRQIRMYPAEPEASKRIRLSQWHQLRRQRGTHQGEMRHAQPYFLPDTPIIRIVHQAGDGSSATWHTLDGAGVYTIHRATPSNWNYDGHATQWSRWWVILYAPTSVIAGLTFYDDGHTYDGGQIYDGVLTQVALDIRDMFLEWHSAHSRPQSVILATDPASFNPSSTAVTDPSGWTSLPVGNWGSPLSPPPAVHRTRPPTALWIYDHGP